MNAENFSVKQLLTMAHSPVSNYAIPGLTSWLIGQPSPTGTIRMFVCEREHQEAITPHSHRFDFQCWVLAGTVRNRVWRESHFHDQQADKFLRTPLIFAGGMGEYERGHPDVARFRYSDSVYETGQCYSMEAAEIHSIYFSRGARVLFFEGPTTHGFSQILEPYVDNEVVPTFKVEPWMFKRAA